MGMSLSLDNRGLTAQPPSTRFQKGNAGGPGRKLGSMNRHTAEARELVSQLIENNGPSVQEWINRVSARDALAIYVSLLEFILPKIARTELTANDGAPLEVTITWRPPGAS